ncbi:hypothetical protein ACFB49_41870 [Sphingomonas sp. DBB INV C78]|uniref:DUF1697 domain-containing protein n=1 Tax=Sphingomonas sp. DBB INV C78 TaxID=3349434 RepID=UPI0036D253B6
MTQWIALLRAINVGKRQVPMAELRKLGEDLGHGEVRTYLASGNLLFTSSKKAEVIEKELEAAIAKRFGFPVEIILRTAAQWAQHGATNPLPQPSTTEPNRVMMLTSKQPAAADAVARLQERAAPNETIKQGDGAIWIHFGDGAGTSKLTPSYIDKAVGSPSTARNWRTVQALTAMTGGTGG